MDLMPSVMDQLVSEDQYLVQELQSFAAQKHVIQHHQDLGRTVVKKERDVHLQRIAEKNLITIIVIKKVSGHLLIKNSSDLLHREMTEMISDLLLHKKTTSDLLLHRITLDHHQETTSEMMIVEANLGHLPLKIMETSMMTHKKISDVPHRIKISTDHHLSKTFMITDLPQTSSKTTDHHLPPGEAFRTTDQEDHHQTTLTEMITTERGMNPRKMAIRQDIRIIRETLNLHHLQ